MKAEQLKKAITTFKNYCATNQLNFVIIGSVGYREGLSIQGDVPCDDLDCVIIYEHIQHLKNCPFISSAFYNKAVSAISNEDADLFATKFTLEDVHVSLDFISINYFKYLATMTFTTKSVLFKKLTDAIETATNTYSNFYNQSYTYTKKVTPYDAYSIYHLPVFLYSEEASFTGVLYNKLLFSPIFLNVAHQEILTLHAQLLQNYVAYYEAQKDINDDARYYYAIRNWHLFSKNNKQRIQQLFLLPSKQLI